MHEFNLIPDEYRTRMTKNTLLRRVGVGSCVISCVIGIALWSSHSWVSAKESQAAELHAKKALNGKQQVQLAQLKSRKDFLLDQVLMFESLRNGAPFEEVIETVEKAITPDTVWFLRLHFRRQGIVVENDPIARAPSYFVMTEKAKAFPRSWHNLTHMTIEGEARDHAALSTFVQRLFTHPTVDDVRVQRSTRGDTSVRFNLAVVVKTASQSDVQNIALGRLSAGPTT